MLRLARLIEYGGPLPKGAARRTLVKCHCKQACQTCEGFLWVIKTWDDLISTWCPSCERQEVSILGWEDTAWADGPSPPELPEERVWN